MLNHHGAVLMVDDDIALMLVLAHELHRKGINLIPSTSAKQARSMVATLEPVVDVLIINCRISGICTLAKEIAGRHDHLEVIGVVSKGYECSSCRGLFTFTFHDPELRDVRWMQRMVSLIQSRLVKKPSHSKITILRRTEGDKR